MAVTARVSVVGNIAELVAAFRIAHRWVGGDALFGVIAVDIVSLETLDETVAQVVGFVNVSTQVLQGQKGLSILLQHFTVVGILKQLVAIGAEVDVIVIRLVVSAHHWAEQSTAQRGGAAHHSIARVGAYQL